MKFKFEDYVDFYNCEENCFDTKNPCILSKYKFNFECILLQCEEDFKEVYKKLPKGHREKLNLNVLENKLINSPFES